MTGRPDRRFERVRVLRVLWSVVPLCSPISLLRLSLLARGCCLRRALAPTVPVRCLRSIDPAGGSIQRPLDSSTSPPRHRIHRAVLTSHSPAVSLRLHRSHPLTRAHSGTAQPALAHSTPPAGSRSAHATASHHAHRGARTPARDAGARLCSLHRCSLLWHRGLGGIVDSTHASRAHLWCPRSRIATCPSYSCSSTGRRRDARRPRRRRRRLCCAGCSAHGLQLQQPRCSSIDAPAVQWRKQGGHRSTSRAAHCSRRTPR